MWKNELPDPKKMAHVHVVIIGFSTDPPEKRRLYYDCTDENGEIHTAYREVDNINFYLHEGPDKDIAEPTDSPICENAPAMIIGGIPRDGGNLIIEAEDYAEFIRREPGAEKFIRRYIGAYEFINNKPRYCLWLVGANPDDIRKCPKVKERIERVKAFRKASTRKATQKQAQTPSLFAEIRYSNKNYVAIPAV